MKNLMFALLTTIALQAHANDVSPALDTQSVSALPFIQLSIGGGMPAPGGIAHIKITVLTNGTVNVHEIYFNKDWNNPWSKGEERNYQLPALRNSDMRLLSMNVVQLSGGEFRKYDQPQCMDAPSYHYAVYKNGQWVNVYQIEGCVDQELADAKQNVSARTVKAFLDELYAKTTSR